MTRQYKCTIRIKLIIASNDVATNSDQMENIIQLGS